MSNRFIPERSDKETGSTSGYEFGPGDDADFASLGSAMRFVAVLTIIFGVIIGIGATTKHDTIELVAAIIQAGAMIAIGSWLAAAAGSFKAITVTKGMDIAHLMMAIRKLKSVYVLQAVLLAIASLVVLMAVLTLVGKH